MTGYPKIHLFKSFTGLRVQEFDNIYSKEIKKRYYKHEIQRLSFKRKEIRKRKIGPVAGISNWVLKIDF